MTSTVSTARVPNVDHCPKPGKIGSMTLDADNPFAGPSTLPYQLTPMGTILEGEWDETMAVVTACFEHLRKVGCTRISLHLKVDWREGPAGRLKAKTAKVEQLLGRPLRT